MKYIIAYGVAALLTFGYVASSSTCKESLFTTKEECEVAKGVLGGMLWPMYWTWEGFSLLRGDDR